MNSHDKDAQNIVLWSVFLVKTRELFYDSVHGTGGGGNSAYDRGGDASRKFWIRPLKETDLGVAQAFFWLLKETKRRQYIYFYILHPKWDQNPKFTPLSETTSIPTPFICRVPPPGMVPAWYLHGTVNFTFVCLRVKSVLKEVKYKD